MDGVHRFVLTIITLYSTLLLVGSLRSYELVRFGKYQSRSRVSFEHLYPEEGLIKAARLIKELWDKAEGSKNQQSLGYVKKIQSLSKSANALLIAFRQIQRQPKRMISRDHMEYLDIMLDLLQDAMEYNTIARDTIKKANLLTIFLECKNILARLDS